MTPFGEHFLRLCLLTIHPIHFSQKGLNRISIHLQRISIQFMTRILQGWPLNSALPLSNDPPAF